MKYQFSQRSVLAGLMLLPLLLKHPCLALADVFQTLPYVTVGLGTQSGCAHGAKMALTDEAQWQRVWNTHLRGLHNAPVLPTVDFTRQIVLVLLDGAAPAGTSIEVAQVVQGPQTTLVYYFVNQDDVAPGHKANATQPFHFAVIDKPATPIRFVDAVGRTCSDCGK